MSLLIVALVRLLGLSKFQKFRKYGLISIVICGELLIENVCLFINGILK